MTLRHSLPLLLAAVALAACTGTTVYSHYTALADEEWFKSDTLVFDLPAVDRDGHYTATIGLRTTPQYPYANLSLAVTVTDLRTGAVRHRDTLSLCLADSDGQQHAPGLSLRHHAAPPLRLTLRGGAPSAVSRPPADSLRVVVAHTMRRELLPGIADVGLTLCREP